MTRTASVEFCKNFWSITESDIMQVFIYIKTIICKWHFSLHPGLSLFLKLQSSDLQIVLQAVPSLVCPSIKVNEVIHLKPEPFELPAVNTDNPNDMVMITPPCAHTGPGVVKVRLMSFEPREGQVCLPLVLQQCIYYKKILKHSLSYDEILNWLIYGLI